MRHLVSLLIVTAAAALMPAWASQQHAIPLELTRSGHLVAELTINETSQTTALIDTAATFPMIDDAVAAGVGVAPDSMPAMVDIIGIGPVSTFPVVDMGSLSLGNLPLTGARMAYNAEFDLPGAVNVIPAGSIPLRTLDFDFPRSRLLAYDRRPRHVTRAVTSRLPIEWMEGLPFMRVEVNGREGLALIDTGANVSYLNSVFARNAARSLNDFRTVELVGATGSTRLVSILSSRDFTLGGFNVRRFDVYVSDPEFLASIGLDDQPVMVIGLDILSRFRVQIDRVDSEISFCLPQKHKRNGPGMTLYNDW